jgi:hypothetical protein
MFVHAERASDEGWMLQYMDQEQAGTIEARIPLEILLDAMRLGHAASELLRLASFSRKDGAGIAYQPPPWTDGERIWRTIVGHPTPDSESAR